MRSPGDPIHVETAKWGDRPHWHRSGVWLGRDDHGEWLGFPRGTHNHRPGFDATPAYAFDSVVDSVLLVQPGVWRLPTFHAPGIWCSLYVDMTTPARWDGAVLRAVDLDLDVIAMSADGDGVAPSGRVVGAGNAFVDDEDEFAAHRISFGYPEDVVASARASADDVLRAHRAGAAPYDGSHLRWLDVLAGLIPS